MQIILHIQSDLPEVLVGDVARLRQVALNLIDNAIKFTNDGEIAIQFGMLRQTDEEVVLQCGIRDTGPGIPPDIKENIFDSFFQGDASTTKKYPGVGLGLAISRQLVRMMDGDIWVNSEPGRGSTFHFTVRLKKVQEPGPRRNEILEKKQNRPQDTPAPPVKNLKILLAEDNPINQRLAERLLENRGHTVTTADNGKEALIAFENGDFDLVIMDIQMPEMDGIEATKAIRASESGTRNHLPILAMTAYAMDSDRKRILEAGMDAYLAKPINPAEFYRMIEELAVSKSTKGKETG